MNLSFKGRSLTFSGIVIGEDHHENYTKLTVNVEKAFLKTDTIDYHIPVQLYTRETQTYLGRKLFIKGHIKPAHFPHQPHIMVGNIITTETAQNPFGTVFYTIRNYITSCLRAVFNDDCYRIASGLILGGSSRVGKDLKEVFSRAGVLHILAVSGLHVGFVCLFISFILFFIPVSSKIKFIIVMIILLIYAGVVGFRPSICRATVMALLFGIAIILQRNVDGLHIINISAMVLLLVDPLLLFDVGAQLSFAAVYGIIYLYPKIEKTAIRRVKNRFAKIILTSMVVSFSAQIFVSPLLIYYFHRLPTLAVFSNLIVVPIATGTIFLLFICLLFGLFSIAIAKLIAFPVSLLLFLLVTVSKFFANIEFSALTMTISPFLLISFYFLFPARLRKYGLFVMLIIIAIFSVASYSDCAIIRITNDGTIISQVSGENIFITEKQNTNVFNLLGVNKLDYLIARRRIYPARKDFFALPQAMYYKKIQLGEMVIELQQRQKIRYHNFEVNINEHIPEKGDVQYIITDGNISYEFVTTLYNSIVGQIIVDTKIIFAKLKFLF